MIALPASPAAATAAATPAPPDKGGMPSIASGGFAMGRFEVTVDEYAAFVRATGHATSRLCVFADIKAPNSGNVQEGSFLDPGYTVSGRHPAVCVSWLDASAYVRWLSVRTGKRYRLPSDVEWVYAAQAGTSTRYSFGDDASTICHYANLADASSSIGHAFKDCSDGVGSGTAPVGSYAANPWGLFDVHGNVWEWTDSCWSPEPSASDAVRATTSTCDEITAMGGSWLAGPGFVTSTARSRQMRSMPANARGFRVLRWPDP